MNFLQLQSILRSIWYSRGEICTVFANIGILNHFELIFGGEKYFLTLAIGCGQRAMSAWFLQFFSLIIILVSISVVKILIKDIFFGSRLIIFLF